VATLAAWLRIAPDEGANWRMDVVAAITHSKEGRAVTVRRVWSSAARRRLQARFTAYQMLCCSESVKRAGKIMTIPQLVLHGGPESRHNFQQEGRAVDLTHLDCAPPASSRLTAMNGLALTGTISWVFLGQTLLRPPAMPQQTRETLQLPTLQPRHKAREQRRDA